mmetsp:Transcript_73099/g.123169  ORF Transcript_73099/g.123169 Transcript_73099/m.123169 type:complete len:569 (-) Transcript_73099:1552-3258(-)
MDLTLKEYHKHQEWDNIVVTSDLPGVNDEANINSFLSVWKEAEHEVPGGEDRKRDIDKDFIIVEQAVALIQNILDEIDSVGVDNFSMATKSKLQPRKGLDFHRQNLINLYTQIQNTLDKLTANVMQYLDQYVDDGDDQPLTLCKSTENIKYGLWCGNKFPRVRSVDYSPLSIVISPKDGAHLPKQLNLMNNVAMRVLQFSYDPQSVHQKDDIGLEYYALGGVVVVETMAVPAAAKLVKDWTLRTETHLATEVHRHPYPPASTDSSGPQAPPIRVSFQVPACVVVRHTAPVIGIWSTKHHCWLPDGTNDFSYDKSTRNATFLTQNLTKLAIIQEKGFDVPYENWYMYPIDQSSVMFVIEGRRRHEISDRVVKILLQNNLCKVLEPEEPELDYLRKAWYTPATLLRHLSNSGYNFVLKDTDADYTPDILPKSHTMEDKGYNDLALFCTTFEFASTRHNKFGEDRNMCLFRVSKAMRDEENNRPLQVDLEDDSKWHTVRYEKERCVLTKCKESNENANIEELPGCDTHLNLYTVMAAEFPQDNIDARINSDELLQNAVKQLLSLVRPFTWG